MAIWGEAQAELNDLDRAIQLVTKGVELTERGQDAMVIGWSNLCLTRVLFSSGELVAAAKNLQKVEAMARNYDLPPFVTNPMAAWQARIGLAQEKLDAAVQWGSERGLDAEGGSLFLHEMEYVVLARILIAQGQLDKAARLLQRLLKTMELRDIDKAALGFLTMAMRKPLWEEIWIGILGIYCAIGLWRRERHAWTLSLIWGIMRITNAAIQGGYEIILLDWSNACLQTYLFLSLGTIAVASLLLAKSGYLPVQNRREK